MNNYQILGVDYDADERTIKRAYAKLIKEFRPDSHPTEFARIRNAYERLLENCRYQPEVYDFPDTEQTEVYDFPETEQTEPNLIIESDTEIIEQPLDILIDKPFINLSKESKNNTENSDDRFNRLVDKPILPPTETSLSFTTPEFKFNDLTNFSDANDWQWAKEIQVDISEMIQKLNAFSQAHDEKKTLACFQEQKFIISRMSLDQRMNYEQKLYESLINNEKPSLLLFSAASDYFAWQQADAWFKRTQTTEKKQLQRFDSLSQLADIYHQAYQQRNRYFQAQPIKPKWFTTHHHLELEKQQRETWFITCYAANLLKLHNYFSEEPQRQPIYLADVLLGAMLGCFISMIVSNEIVIPYAQQSLFWAQITPPLTLLIGALLGAILTSFLLLGCRILNFNISTKAKWLALFVAIASTARTPKSISTSLIIITSALIILGYAYQIMTLLESVIVKLSFRLSKLKNRIT